MYIKEWCVGCSIESEMEANTENHLSARLHCREKAGVACNYSDVFVLSRAMTVHEEDAGDRLFICLRAAAEEGEKEGRQRRSVY